MRTSLLTFVAGWLLVAVGAAAAQSYTPAQATHPAQTSAPAPAAPSAAPSTEQPAERPRLMLRLDELDGPRMSFGPSATEKYPAKDLPSLGGNGRPLDRSIRESAFPESSTSAVPTPY